MIVARALRCCLVHQLISQQFGVTSPRLLPVRRVSGPGVSLKRNPSSVFFADDVPPYFKTEPARSQLNLERNKVVLTCMAEGSWPLEFKWIHNDTELTRFSLEYRSEG